MHLTEAGRADRVVVEFLEQLADPGAELLFDRRADVLEGNGTDIILELFELLDVRRRQQVGSRGQYLAKLDVRRPELDEPFTKCRGLLRGRSAIVAALGIRGDAFQALLLREIREAVAREESDRSGKLR